MLKNLELIESGSLGLQKSSHKLTNLLRKKEVRGGYNKRLIRESI